MRAPASSGSGVPVKRWAAAPQPSVEVRDAGRDRHPAGDGPRRFPSTV